jgi:hypothetical protein
MAEEYVESHFGGLLVKISSAVGGDVGGKIYMIPQQALGQYVLAQANVAEFDARLPRDTLINVDFAVYRPDLTVRGSAG